MSEKEKTPDGREREKLCVRIPVYAIHFDDPYWEHKWKNEPIQDKWIEQIENMFNDGYSITINLLT